MEPWATSSNPSVRKRSWTRSRRRSLDMIAKGGDTRRPVCVVDDDASVREAVGGLLRSVGMTVETLGRRGSFWPARGRDAPSCLVST